MLKVSYWNLVGCCHRLVSVAVLLLVETACSSGFGGLPTFLQSSTDNPIVELPMALQPITSSLTDQLMVLYHIEMMGSSRPVIAIDPTSQLLVLGNNQQTHFYDLNTLQDKGVVQPCNEWCPIAFHPDPAQNQVLLGNQLYNSDNLTDPTFAYESPAGYEPSAVAYNQDGTYLAIAYTDRMRSILYLYSLTDNKVENTIPFSSGVVLSLAFNRDSRLIAAGMSNQIAVRETVGICLMTSSCFQQSPIITNTPIFSLAFAYLPVEQMEILITNQKQLWQVTPTQLQRFKEIEPGFITFSANNSLLVVANQQGILVYDLIAGLKNAPHILSQGYYGLIPSVQFSPNGRFLLVGGVLNDNQQLETQIWGIADLRPYLTVEANAPCHNIANVQPRVAFSSDGQILARSTANCLELWEVPYDRPDTLTSPVSKLTTDGPIDLLLFQPDTKELAAAIIAGDTYEVVFLWPTAYSNLHLSHDAPIIDMLFFPPLSDGSQILATLTEDPKGQRILFWNWREGQLLDTLPIEDVRGVALLMTSDNTKLIMPTTTGQLKSWTINDGRISGTDLIGTPSSTHFHDAIYLPHNGPVYLANADTSLYRRNSNNDMKISVSTLHTAQQAASCSMDSQYVGVVSDCQLWVWQVSDSEDEVLTILRTPGDCLEDVVFHPVNSHILTATGETGRLYVWELPYQNNGS